MTYVQCTSVHVEVRGQHWESLPQSLSTALLETRSFSLCLELAYSGWPVSLRNLSVPSLSVDTTVMLRPTFFPLGRVSGLELRDPPASVSGVLRPQALATMTCISLPLIYRIWGTVSLGGGLRTCLIPISLLCLFQQRPS